MSSDRPAPPFAAQKQPMPGTTARMEPRPDHGESSYRGSGRLRGLRAIITGGLAQMLAEKSIRVNAVTPGPIWTPLIPSTMPEEVVTGFGKQVPMKRPGQPAELATAYVMLADPLSSDTSGTTGAVAGGKPFI